MFLYGFSVLRDYPSTKWSAASRILNMTQKTTAEVALSFLEYRGSFREPLLEIWGHHGPLVHAVYTAFREWNVSLENVTAKENPANASEFQVNFNLLNWKVIFGVGIGSVSFTVANPDWSEVELVKKIGRAGLEAVFQSTRAELEKQSVTLSMHLRPQGRTVRDVTSRFVHADVGKTLAETVRGVGFSVYGEQSLWVIDLSATYPDAIFVRIARTFDGATPLDGIAAELETQENRLLDMLGLELD